MHKKYFFLLLQNVALQLLTVMHSSCALYSLFYDTSSIMSRKKHITLSVLTRQAAQKAAWLLLPVCCWAKVPQKRSSLTHVSCSLSRSACAVKQVVAAAFKCPSLKSDLLIYSQVMRYNCTLRFSSSTLVLNLDLKTDLSVFNNLHYVSII